MMLDGMMWGMGIGGLLAIIIAVLVIAALIKHICSSDDESILNDDLLPTFSARSAGYS